MMFAPSELRDDSYYIHTSWCDDIQSVTDYVRLPRKRLRALVLQVMIYNLTVDDIHSLCE